MHDLWGLGRVKAATCCIWSQVGDRAAWKSQDHPFRQDAQLHLTSIPTLIHWKADETSPGRRLDKQLEAGHTEAEVKQTVLAFTEQAKEQDS